MPSSPIRWRIYRQQIDDFGDNLMVVLEKRMIIADKIGRYKKQNNVTIFQPSRWDQILKRRI
jgi:chorismate mutase